MAIAGWIVCLALCGGEAALPEGVIARVDGQDVTLDAYKDYLLRLVGKDRLQHFIDELLVEKKSKELGIAVTAEETAQKVDEEIQRQVEGFFKGETAKLKEQLAQRGMTIDEYRAQRAPSVRFELLLERCVIQSRVVDDQKVRERFEADYGKDGVSYDLRHVLVAARAQSQTPDPESEAAARTKAERILREVRDGVDFAEMANLYSDDTHSKKMGGRIAKYRAGMYGAEFDAAVNALTEQSPLSGIVKSPRGFHIIQLLGKKTTPLEAVKDELRKILVEEKPSAKERYDYIEALRKAATIVK
ncbi:MAG TPA: peptidylprolyl isomerase [Planctomycetota bacterium]|jgi:parvulin-like peptidyl-prolyl isomerase|nr:peptidylprolyl isomerase [Planctomycetota bacterium]OQC19564.1 MAG: Foldase protein PrsA 2 precursor [Planctomycetes bacterium ADurb.Bin069]NMD35043.1 hypothetical protein [Planctomycetota bacterium]HNR98975.1 peptidylprolyl isomerase [Planctomycetota bacterium]HNU27026.1 peptidylprolyl isomerase [Planctomycetota bacterium]